MEKDSASGLNYCNNESVFATMDSVGCHQQLLTLVIIEEKSKLYLF